MGFNSGFKGLNMNSVVEYVTIILILHFIITYKPTNAPSIN